MKNVFIFCLIISGHSSLTECIISIDIAHDIHATKLLSVTDHQIHPINHPIAIIQNDVAIVNFLPQRSQYIIEINAQMKPIEV